MFGTSGKVSPHAEKARMEFVTKKGYVYALKVLLYCTRKPTIDCPKKKKSKILT